MNKPLALLFLFGGLFIFLVGLLFHLLKWPDMFFGIYTGPLIMIIGIILLVYINKKRSKGNNRKELP